MIQIHYAGKISKDDFLKALVLHNSQLKRQKWVYGIILICIPFLLVYLMFREPVEFSILRQAMFPYGLLPLVLLTLPWWMPYLQLSVYDKKGNIYRNNVYGMINETEITIHGANISAAFKWNAYIEYKITENMFLLYHGENAFNIFTTSMFSNQDEWEKFIVFAKDQVSLNKTRNTSKDN